jgi:hypothetical protein
MQKKEKMKKKIVRKKPSTRMLNMQEILQLDPLLIIPTIKAQGRSLGVEKTMLHRANRWLYTTARSRHLNGMIDKLKNNLFYLKEKYDLSYELMDEVIIKYSNQDKPIRFNNLSFSTGIRSFSDVFEYSFAFGYAFNIKTTVLLHDNLEYLDSINCVDPFEHYIGNPSDLDLPVVVNTTKGFRKDLLRKINREQRTGIKNKDL